MESQPVNTYRGVALVGWMERDRALQFLTEDCIHSPALTQSAAESLWRGYRDRAAALPERAAGAPACLPLTETERLHAERFLEFFKGMSLEGVEVVKVDPSQLVVAQYHVAIDQAERYRARCATDEGWMAEALPTSPANERVEIKLTQRNFDTDIDIDLPHAEFIFGKHPQGGFWPSQLLGHVMVARAGNRLVVGKGYHRLYARALSTGLRSDHPILVALDPNRLFPPPTENSGISSAGANDLDIFGRRPAVFADFFTEGLFMPVNLRKKHYQLQVRARWVAMNEEP